MERRLPDIRTVAVDKARAWLKSRVGLHTVLWTAGLASWYVSYIVNRRQSGALAALRYLGTAACLAVALTLTTEFPVPALLMFPLLAVYSVMVPPRIIGYGGQMFLFALWTTLILNVAGGIASLLLKRRPMPEGLLRRVVAGQVALSLLALGASGGFALLLPATNRGEKVTVRPVVVQGRLLATDAGFSGMVSRPLVEESRAFVATEAGTLHEIDLESGRVVRKVGLPRPEPAEVGLKGLVKCPDYASAAMTGRAVIASTPDPDLLSVVYPFYVGIGTEYGWGVAQKSWRIEAEVDLTEGQVSRWSLVEGYMPEEGPHVYEVTAGECTAKQGNDEIRITGPGVDSVVWTKGYARYLAASGKHVVAVAGGTVYVITVP